MAGALCRGGGTGLPAGAWSGARLCPGLLTHSAAEHPWEGTARLPALPPRRPLRAARAPWEPPARASTWRGQGGDKGGVCVCGADSPSEEMGTSGTLLHSISPGPAAHTGPVIKEPPLESGPSSGEGGRSFPSQDRLQLRFPPGFPRQWRLVAPAPACGAVSPAAPAAPQLLGLGDDRAPPAAASPPSLSFLAAFPYSCSQLFPPDLWAEKFSICGK